MADDAMHDDESELWTSPPRDMPSEPRPKTPKTSRTPRTPKTPEGQHGSRPMDREAALRRELEGVRNINEVIEGLIGTLQRTEANMEVVSKTVSNASTLLNTWTRILSQTEHNQRLILNTGFKGATEDLLEIEEEEQRRQQALKRRAAEEEERREEARRRREEEEGKRQMATSSRGTRGTTGTRGARGRPRSASRVASVSSSSRMTEPSTTSSAGAPRGRGASGIARGSGTSRSRYGAAK